MAGMLGDGNRDPLTRRKDIGQEVTLSLRGAFLSLRAMLPLIAFDVLAGWRSRFRLALLSVESFSFPRNFDFPARKVLFHSSCMRNLTS